MMSIMDFFNLRKFRKDIEKNIPIMNLIQNQNKEVSLIFFDLWKIYQKYPTLVEEYLTKCSVYEKSVNNGWVFPKEIFYFRDLKNVNPKYSQLYATTQTLSKKLDIFNKIYTHKKIKRVFLLGDDDLLSLALARNFKDLDITVLDIDKKIITYINYVSQKNKYKINAKKYNVYNPLPNTVVKKFDYFFFDSSHCLGGYISFLTRSINSLNMSSQGGQFIIQLVDDLPVFTRQERKRLFKFIKSTNLDIDKIEPRTVTYEIPKELILDFRIQLLGLFRKESISKEKLKRFLIKFGFPEFLPGVSPIPEAIISLRRTKEITYPDNCSINNSFIKKWGEMYFYKEYEEKR